MLTRIASREVGQDKDKDKDVAHFGKAFGKSLNLEHIPFTAQLMKKVLGDNVDRRPNWRRALEAFKNAGTVYKTKHNKLPVIVYDNISGLINTNPKYLSAVKEASQEECSLVVPGHRQKNCTIWLVVELKTVADDFLNGVINSQS
ncbi:unnamed protein product [Rhizophagus irregularis]|uniref:Uncharacterized protein n=1 Tax=Rhizophagus irregularis TaxID=588596 RepID=A0A916DZ17_9GLOM|nr:unnamed protein product [Rhizophagus irregularis]